MNEPINQHIIPKCYLRAFVDPIYPKKYGPRVWLFKRDSRKGLAKSPASILTEDDVYTIVVNGQKNYTIETSLNKLEDKYARLHKKKITKRLPLTDEEHIYLSAFVVAMMFRTTGHRKNLARLFDQLEEQADGNIEFLEQLRYARENSHKTDAITMLPRVVNILMNMHIAFVCADKSAVKFISSDNPVVLFNPRLQWAPSFTGPGLMQKHIEIVMPLSPNTAVYFTWHDFFRGYINIDETRVQEQNRLIRGHCDEHFIASSGKASRIWFSKYPYDPIFIARILFFRGKYWLIRVWRKVKRFR